MPSLSKRIFSNLDIFGSPIGLNFQKGNVYRTSFGAFISIVFAVFMGLFFWNTVNIVKVAMSKTYSTNPSTIKISPNELMFAVKVDSPNFINNPIFNITLERRDYVNHENGTLDRNRYPMYLEPCTLDHWTQLPSYNINWTDQFIKANLSSYLCPRRNLILFKGQINKQTLNLFYWLIRKQDLIEIGGIFSSQHFKHIRISVTDCKNNTPIENPWRPVCASPQFIKSYFDSNKNVRVVMQVVNYIINPPDPSNYITSFLDNQLFFTVNPNSYQTADIYFHEYEFVTDNSIMPFKQIETKKLPVLENGNFRAQQFLYTQTSFGDFFFRRDPVTYTLNRQFQKVSEVISYIGGFSQIFLSISAVLVCFYNDYIYSVQLANKLYNFEINGQDKQNEGIKYQQNVMQNMYTQESSPQIQGQFSNNQNDKQIKLRHDLKKIETNLPSLSYIQKVNSNFQGNIFINKDLKQMPNQNQLQNNIKQKNVSIQLNQSDLHRDQIENQDQILNKQPSLEYQVDNINYKDKEQNLDYQNQELSQIQYIPDEDNHFSNQIKSDKDQIFMSWLNSKQIHHEKENQKNNIQDNNQESFNKAQQVIQPEKDNHSNEIDSFQDSFNKAKQDLTVNIQNSKNENQHTYEFLSPTSDQNIKILIYPDSKTERPVLFNEKEMRKSKFRIEKNIFQSKSQTNIHQINPKNYSNEQNKSFNHLNCDNNQYKQVSVMSDNNLCILPQLFDQNIFSAPKIQSGQNIYNKQAEASSSPYKCQTYSVTENAPQLTNKQNFLKQKFTQLLKREGNLMMTYKFFMYKLTCKKLCKTKQVLLVEKAHQLIRKDLDVSVILFRLKELEKFKKLFLNEQQEVLFNFFPKPIITSNYQKELPSRLNIQETQNKKNNFLKSMIHSLSQSKFNKKVQKTFQVNAKVAAKVSVAVQKLKQPLKNSNYIFQYDQISAYQALYEAYLTISHKKELTKFDKKLIVLLGQEMKGIFEESEKIKDKNIHVSNQITQMLLYSRQSQQK